MDFGTRRSPPVDPGDGDIIKDGTTASFGKDVIEASKDVPIIVDFWAAWCLQAIDPDPRARRTGLRWQGSSRENRR